MKYLPVLKGLAAAAFCVTAAMAQEAPKADRFTEICIDRQAGAAGALAYLEARLVLTDKQRPLFEHWKKIKLASIKAADCAPPPGGEPSIIDNLKHEELMLRARLAELKAETPALEALIAALTPEQKKMFLPHPDEPLGFDRPPHDGAQGDDGPPPGDGPSPPEF